MTDRPYSFTVRSSDNRGLAVALLGDASVFGVELNGDRLTVRTSMFSDFGARRSEVAARGHHFAGLIPADESLESVFSYLVTPSTSARAGR
jgi:ABC-2 type transport system ATP-binding protein